MKVILFGASGMVGQGVLRECLLDPEVTEVLSVGRSASGPKNPKLVELILGDFLDFSPIASQLAGFDACFFCLGVSSVGMSEADYRRITYGFTSAAAKTLAQLNPGMTFIYVSGAGTDGTGKGRVMWARVKGETENAVFTSGFKGAYAFRPAGIQPLQGIRSRSKAVQVFYTLTKPLLPVLLRFPKFMTTTEQLGRAMLKVAKEGYPKPGA